MEKYTLTAQDYKIIDDIIGITNTLASLNDKLCDLEKRGEKDSSEYRIILDHLSMVLELEKKIYSRADLSFEKAYSFFVFLLGTKFSFEYKDDLAEIISSKSQNRVARRILKRISKVLDDYVENTENICLQVPVFGFINVFHIGKETLQKHYNNILKKYFENDKLNAFLFFLQGYIDNERYAMFRNDLIETKYDTIFIYEDNEESLQSLERYSIQISECFLSLRDWDEQLFNDSKNLYAGKEATDQILELYCISDLDYNNIENALKSILRQCLLRSSLTLADDETATDLKKELEKLIHVESKEFSSISLDLILKTFQLASEDRHRKEKLNIPVLEHD